MLKKLLKLEKAPYNPTTLTNQNCFICSSLFKRLVNVHNLYVVILISSCLRWLDKVTNDSLMLVSVIVGVCFKSYVAVGF